MFDVHGGGGGDDDHVVLAAGCLGRFGLVRTQLDRPGRALELSWLLPFRY
jgi:hypothetical protein